MSNPRDSEDEIERNVFDFIKSFEYQPRRQYRESTRVNSVQLAGPSQVYAGSGRQQFLGNIPQQYRGRGLQNLRGLGFQGRGRRIKSHNPTSEEGVCCVSVKSLLYNVVYVPS